MAEQKVVHPHGYYFKVDNMEGFWNENSEEERKEYSS
jgi:hypothetical protein